MKKSILGHCTFTLCAVAALVAQASSPAGSRGVLALETGLEHVLVPAPLAAAIHAFEGVEILEAARDRIDGAMADDALGRLHRRDRVLRRHGRGIGDAAAVLFTAGYTDRIPTSLMRPTATLPLAVFFQLGSPYPEVQQRGYAAALILTLINTVLTFLGVDPNFSLVIQGAIVVLVVMAAGLVLARRRL